MCPRFAASSQSQPITSARLRQHQSQPRAFICRWRSAQAQKPPREQVARLRDNCRELTRWNNYRRFLACALTRFVLAPVPMRAARACVLDVALRAQLATYLNYLGGKRDHAEQSEQSTE
jgi:hypothetical protein